MSRLRGSKLKSLDVFRNSMASIEHITGVSYGFSKYFISSGKSVPYLDVILHDQKGIITEVWSKQSLMEKYLCESPKFDRVYFGSAIRLYESTSSGLVGYKFNMSAHSDISKTIVPDTHVIIRVIKYGNVDCMGHKTPSYLLSEFYNGEFKNIFLTSDDFQYWENSSFVTMLYV